MTAPTQALYRLLGDAADGADLRPSWLVEQLMREYDLTKEDALAVLDGNTTAGFARRELLSPHVPGSGYNPQRA